MVGQLIYAYYIESTELVEAWRAAFTNFSLDTGIFRIDPSTSGTTGSLVDEVIDLMNDSFKSSVNTINPNPEEIRLLWYYRLYGKEIAGKADSFPKIGSNFNRDFEDNFRTLMTYIVHGILDTQTDTEKLADPSAIAQQCHLIQNQIKSRFFNLADIVTSESNGIMKRLLDTLSNDKIMKDILNIRSDKPEERLIEFGKLFDVPVTNKGAFYFSLASNMEALVDRIMNTVWTGMPSPGNPDPLAEATKLYTDIHDVQMIRDIATSYRAIYDIDFFNDTLKIRRGIVLPQ